MRTLPRVMLASAYNVLGLNQVTEAWKVEGVYVLYVLRTDSYTENVNLVGWECLELEAPPTMLLPKFEPTHFLEIYYSPMTKPQIHILKPR